mgnify:CR=1 FL=1
MLVVHKIRNNKLFIHKNVLYCKKNASSVAFFVAGCYIKS